MESVTKRKGSLRFWIALAGVNVVTILTVWALFWPGQLALAFQETKRSTAQGECGAFSLGHVCGMLGVRTTHEDLLTRLGKREAGTSFADLIAVGQQFGLHVKPVRMDVAALSELELPAIAHVHGNHFVTIAAHSFDRKQLLILYDESARIWVSVSDFGKQWQGKLLLFSAPKTPESLWISESELDLGRLHGLDDEPANFIVVNPTNSFIKVKSIKFSCPCAHDPRCDPETLPPKTGATIFFHVNAAQKPPGPLQLRVLLETEGSAKNRAMATVSLAVKPEFRADPGFFGLGEISFNAPLREVATRVRHHSPNGKLPQIQPLQLGPGVSVKSIELINREEYEIRLMVDAKNANPRPNGLFNTGAAFSTGRNDARIGVDIAGRLVPPISMLPHTLYLGDCAPNQIVTRRISVHTLDGLPWKAISSAKCIVSITQVEDSLEVQVRTPNNSSAFEAEIQLFADTYSITLPVLGRVIAIQD